jgi:YD repeat-containing protein
MGRVLSHSLTGGQVQTFTYDANGNVLTHMDFNGFTTT